MNIAVTKKKIRIYQILFATTDNVADYYFTDYMNSEQKLMKLEMKLNNLTDK